MYECPGQAVARVLSLLLATLTAPEARAVRSLLDFATVLARAFAFLRWFCAQTLPSPAYSSTRPAERQGTAPATDLAAAKKQ